MVDILDEREVWRKGGDGDGDMEFSHLAVVYRDGDGLFTAHVDKPVYSGERLDLSRVEGLRIPIDDIYPKHEKGLTMAECVSSKKCYRKKPLLAHYETEMKNGLSQLMLHEAHVGELLRRSPHPNVAKYLGCEVESGRIVALCWQQYESTLADRLLCPVEEQVALQWLEEVQRGLLHMHSLGYCHNDINPSNIMINEDNVAVIIDFDSCRREGEPFGYKSGTQGWSDDSAQLSQTANDMYSFKLVKDFVLKTLSGRRTQDVLEQHD